MNKILPVVIIFELLFSSGSVLAYERGLVKGEVDVVVVENFKIPQGPGFFLPSSPLYSLDLFVNSLKIKLAGSPSEEVRRRGAVAAERLAELKIALEANNPKGIDRALSNLTEHLDGIRTVFVKEKAAGHDVSQLAEEMIDKLTLDYEALEALMAASENVTAKKLEAVETALSETEDSVIEALPNITRERERLRKLTREMVKTTERAEEQVSEANQKAKQALKEASRSLKLKFGEDELATGAVILDDAILKPFEESIEQSDKALEETTKTLERARETVRFNVNEVSNTEMNTEENVGEDQNREMNVEKNRSGNGAGN